MSSTVKHTVQLTWDVAANGTSSNPRITNPDVVIGGLRFRYSCELVNVTPEYPYSMFLELLDDVAFADFDPHWSITIEHYDSRAFSTSSRRPGRFYNFRAGSRVINDEWTVTEFDMHAVWKSFSDEWEAAKCGNDYRIELTEDDGVVWVNRDFLGLDSEYFREQLHLQENSEKLQLTEVKTEDFLDYVYCVHPPALKMTLARVGRIWELAKRFQNQTLTLLCEKFVNGFRPDNPLKRSRHLIEADRFGMSEVFTRTANSLNPVSFRELDMAAVSRFSPQNLQIILDLILSKTPTKEFACAPDFSNFLDVGKARQRNNDSTILIEGSESSPIYVKKAILAANSQYFKTLFFGDFKETNSDPVTLKELSFPDILEYLASVYAPSPPFTVTRSSTILRMADRFQNETLLKQCVDFLLQNEEFSTKEKLETLYVANELNLEKLFETTINRLSRDDLKDIDFQTVTRFQPALLRLFLDRCLQHHK